MLFTDDDRRRLMRIERMLRAALPALLTEEMMTMHNLQEVLDEVRTQRTQIESMASLLASMRAAAKDAIASADDKADAQAKVDALFDAVHSNSQLVVDALNANTGAAPTSTATPPPVTLPPQPVSTDGSGKPIAADTNVSEQTEPSSAATDAAAGAPGASGLTQDDKVVTADKPADVLGASGATGATEDGQTVHGSTPPAQPESQTDANTGTSTTAPPAE